MAKLVVKAGKKYAKYMKEHLAEEHPKTKGKTKVKNGK